MGIKMPNGTISYRTQVTSRLFARITEDPDGPDAQALVKRTRAQGLLKDRSDAEIVQIHLKIWELQGAPDAVS